MLKSISLTQLEADSRSPNIGNAEQLETLARHIQRSGNVPPLIVRPHPNKPDVFVILDGRQRFTVLKRLNWAEAPCVVWEVSDEDAQLYLATLNQLKGQDNPVKRAELIQSLTTSFDLKDLSELLPESEAQLQDLLRYLEQETEETDRQIQAILEKDKTTPPVLLNFLLSYDDSQWVETYLKSIQTDPSKALLQCLKEHAQKELNHG